MKPDYEWAAIKATETLIKNQIYAAPIDPMPILKKLKKEKRVLLFSFSEVSDLMGFERKNLIGMFGSGDAFTSYKDGRYIVTYNMRLPFHLQQRALARELGHIILNHDGSRPEEVREAEALCFARHFLCPRALMKLLEECPIPLNMHTLCDITGCDDRCVDAMQKIPATFVPPELNRLVKEQFTEYVCNCVDYYDTIKAEDDNSPDVDFGSFMDGYKE